MEDTVFSSFIDVGAGTMGSRLRHLGSPSSGINAQDDEDAPPILYAVQYFDATGKMINSRTSPNPIDVDLPDAAASKKKKPVIEIRTRVDTASSAAAARFGGCGTSFLAETPPRYYSDDEVSNASDYSDAGGPRGGRYRNRAPGRRGYQDAVNASGARRPEMIIHSAPLCAALSAVVGYYSGFVAAAEGIKVEAPYEVLFHHRDELRAYRGSQPAQHDEEYAKTTAEHIDVLLGFLDKEFAERLEAETARWENPAGGTATYENFWMLFRPGGVVYKEKDGGWNASVVSGVTRNEPAPGAGGKESYMVQHWDIGYQRGSLRRRHRSTIVHPWNGERAIAELPVVPARFVPGGEEAMAEMQIELGRKYWELAKEPSYREYEGPIVGPDGKRKGILTGRVIVDCEGYERYRDGPDSNHFMPPPPRNYPGNQRPQADTLPQTLPRCPCKPCTKAQLPSVPGPFAAFDNLKPTKSPLPPNESLYFHLLTTSIHAFLLPQRSWGTIRVAPLSPVRPDLTIFNSLVLDPEIKLTVRALIGKFTSPTTTNPDTPTTPGLSPWPSDFIKSKGEGRIFLLHGPPGVGKTCTAECIAELTRRPLLALTSGDISTTPHAPSAERALSYFLALGERFGALVLLDEADVYLEARRTRDLHRNGLVSMFLRALEYYKGVLFLTTNRVEAFDSAFTSRIHVALRYRALRDGERARIWAQNFERLERESAGRVAVADEARAYVLRDGGVRGLRLNGREIRNAMQTAVALAEAEAEEGGKVVVGEACLRAVVGLSRGFKEFLERKKGRKEDGESGESESERDDVEREGFERSNIMPPPRRMRTGAESGSEDGYESA